MRRLLLAGLLLLLAGCGATYQPMGDPVRPPALTADAIVAADGRRLPLRSWLPETGQAVRAAILAIHGFNDYSYAFEGPGRLWAAQGIATYAYDQRGFGAGPQPGIWPGTPTLLSDARTALALVKARHPGVPVYLLGESMGGAIVLSLLGATPPAADMTGDITDEIAGAVLVAPAVWSRDSMPFYQRWALGLSVALFPWLELTGEGLDIMPSDNIAMLRGLGADPLVLKKNRLDTIDGLVTLMSQGADAIGRVDGVPTLFLYGDNEQVLPLEVVDATLARLPDGGPHRVAFYENGYHMLLRDLQARVVIDDIAAWVVDPSAPLPSGADRRGRDRLAALAEAG